MGAKIALGKPNSLADSVETVELEGVDTYSFADGLYKIAILL